MAAVTTVKRIDLAQLIAEVGVELVMDSSGALRTISGDLPQAVLDASVAAHEAATDPEVLRHAQVQAQIDELTDLVLGL